MSSLHALLSNNWNRSYTILSSEHLTNASSKHGKRSTNRYNMWGNDSLWGATQIWALASSTHFEDVDTTIAILVTPGSGLSLILAGALFDGNVTFETSTSV